MSNMNQLAETLAKCGLAMSSSEAMRMAESITSTEKQVTKTFIEKSGDIENSYAKKKTYQEEIDELIQKTSPEKKNFHYMVKGYKEDERRERVGESRHGGSFAPVEQAKAPEQPKTNAIRPAEVYSEGFDDERPLNELMAPMPPIQKIVVTTDSKVYSELDEFTRDDDFIMPMEAKPMPQQKVEIKVEQKAQPAPAVEVKKEFKNPIPKVDILNFFKK
ncbi:MAG: hypothetical protein NDI94_06855 [Candidatus Woesearchaeota archaeon]|nr:hypothetical protein [Candidatus Woesearchaeota archaeon]